MAGTFSAYGRMTARPGRRDELFDELSAIVRSFAEEVDLLHCTINLDGDDADAVWVTELWTDQAAHDRATKTERNKAKTVALMDLLAGPPVISYGTVALLSDAT